MMQNRNANSVGNQGRDESAVEYWLRSSLAGLADSVINFADPATPLQAFDRLARSAARGYTDYIGQPFEQAARAAFDTRGQQEARAARAQQPPQWVQAVQGDAAAATRAAPAVPAPAANTPITSLFMFDDWARTGQPGDPRDGGRRRHGGWDFAPRRDSRIRASRPFEVLSTRNAGNGGLTARVRFDNGQVVDVMHLDPQGVPPVGHRGGRGDMIGIAGRTGNATGISTHIQPVGGAAEGGGGAAGSAGPPGMEAWQSYAGPALERINEAMQMALTPQQLSVDLPRPPDIPEPTPFAAPDFSAGDAAFEAARPQNPFAEAGSETRLLRENFFRGMAEAMLSINPGSPVGFGELLMRAGAGALGGRMRGAEEVRRRTERFEQQIQQYNMSLAQRNDQQAMAQANVINQNIDQANRHVQQVAAQNLQDFHRRNSIDVQGNAVVMRRQGEGDQVQLTIAPIASMVAPQYAMAQAQIMAGGAGAAQQNAQWGYQLARLEAMNYAALGLGPNAQLTPQQQLEAAGVAYAGTIMPAVESGRWRAWMQPQVADDVLARAYGELGVNPQTMADPNVRRQVEPRLNNWLTEYLVGQAMRDPAWGQHIMGTYGGAASRAVQRVRGQRESRRVTRGPRGVSVTESESMSYD